MRIQPCRCGITKAMLRTCSRDPDGCQRDEHAQSLLALDLDLATQADPNHLGEPPRWPSPMSSVTIVLDGRRSARSPSYLTASVSIALHSNGAPQRRERFLVLDRFTGPTMSASLGRWFEGLRTVLYSSAQLKGRLTCRRAIDSPLTESDDLPMAHQLLPLELLTVSDYTVHNLSSTCRSRQLEY
jgi:hypothetical protein